MVHRHLLEPRHLPTPANCSLRKPRPKTRQLRQLWLCAAPPVNNAQAAQAAKLRRTAQECGILGQSVRLCTWQFPFHQRPLPTRLSRLGLAMYPEAPCQASPQFSIRKRNSCSLPAIPELSQNGTYHLQNTTRLVSGFCKRLWECMCLPLDHKTL